MSNWTKFVTGLAGLMLCGSAVAAEFKTVHYFDGADGADPSGGLAFHAGEIYGTTSSGGANNFGTIYEIKLQTGLQRVIHSFAGTDGTYPASGVVYLSGSLYGTTNGYGYPVFAYPGVYQFGLATGDLTVMGTFPYFTYPEGVPVILHRVLYGTNFYTSDGAGLGSVFQVMLSTQTVSTLYNFQGGADQGNPQGGLIYVKGVLYGTTDTVYGGYGTIFELNPKTGAEEPVYTFSGGADGGFPYSSLLYSNGLLYGTTDSTVFSFNPSTKVFTTLHSFGATGDGIGPESSLILVGGLLYGTTTAGGASGDGTIFTVDPVTTSENIVHSFSGTDGSGPSGNLILEEGVLYSTTQRGGADNDGTVFQFQP